jgi:hypothetical protein
MKLLILILASVAITSCSLIPEYDNLGPDLGIRVKTPQEAFAYINDHIRETGQIDHYMPAKTLKNGYGSCVDRSLLALKIIHDSGIDDGQLVYCLFPKREGHAWIKVNGTEYDPGYVTGQLENNPEDYSGQKHILNYRAIVNSAWFLRINLN